MKKREIAFIVVALLAVVILCLWARQELRIDSCLDRGGRWNSVTSACEAATE
jgi:hypothetical protein